VDPLPFDEVPQRLDDFQLALHQNSYYAPDPRFKGKVCDTTPFISLTAGCVQRDDALAANVVHRAHLIAVDFATDFGTTRGHLFYCWVVANRRPAVAVRNVAEELRDLNSNRPYSAYQLEGEIAAKIDLPAPQILAYQTVEYQAARLVVGRPTTKRGAAPYPLSAIEGVL
jgi:hypothetical protein